MTRTDYREWITDDGLLMIESWARDGLTDEQIANNIGCAYSTLKEWKKKYSAVSAALKKGKRPIDFEVENALLKNALGFKYTEEEMYKDDDGKMRVRKVNRYQKPDTTAQIFWLKNRKPEIWRDRQNIDVQNNIKFEDSNARFRKYLRELDGGENGDGGMGQDSSE